MWCGAPSVAWTLTRGHRTLDMVVGRVRSAGSVLSRMRRARIRASGRTPRSAGRRSHGDLAWHLPDARCGDQSYRPEPLTLRPARAAGQDETISTLRRLWGERDELVGAACPLARRRSARAAASREVPSIPRSINSRSASKAATWATSVRDGFAPARYPAEVLERSALVRGDLAALVWRPCRPCGPPPCSVLLRVTRMPVSQTASALGSPLLAARAACRTSAGSGP